MSQADRDKVIKILQLASLRCNAALQALADPSTGTELSNSTNSDALLSTLLTDFNSLLSLIYQSTTKLAIALKPSDPTYLAALTPLKDLTHHVDALASCACSIDGAKFGNTFAREVRWKTEEVINALQSLLGVFTAEAFSPGTGAAETYLAKTGTVHGAIELARKFPRSNREAVRERWEVNVEGLEDCMKELQEAIDEEEESGNDENDAELDEEAGDGWDDLGVSSAEGNLLKASEEELSRLRSAHSFFKFTHALLKRISSSILASSSLLKGETTSSLDSVLGLSNDLLKVSDELVLALSIPQDIDAVSEQLELANTILTGLHQQLCQWRFTTERSGVDDLQELTNRLKLNGDDDSAARVSKERRWFDTCFAQIHKSHDRIIGS